MKKFFFFLCLIIPFGYANAQTEEAETDSSDEDDFVLVIPPINEQLKLGVKMGTGIGMMLGGKLENPRPKYVISGGGYLHYRFSRHWSVQPEINVAFKGSNFANGDNEYTSITMYTADFPLLIMYGLNEKNKANVFVGAQYSHTLNRAMYNKGGVVPESPTPDMHDDDWFAVAGAQFHTPFLGFQIAAKYGLRDLNTGLSPTMKPVNTSGEIHQAVLELNILF